jgi:hypothetical protein
MAEDSTSAPISDQKPNRMAEDSTSAPKRQKRLQEIKEKTRLSFPSSKNVFLSPFIFDLVKMYPSKGKAGLRLFLGPEDEHNLYVVMCSSLLCAKARERNPHQEKAFRKSWPTVLSVHNTNVLRHKFIEDDTRPQHYCDFFDDYCTCGEFSYNFDIHGKMPFKKICKDAWIKACSLKPSFAGDMWMELEKHFQKSDHLCCRGITAVTLNCVV